MPSKGMTPQIEFGTSGWRAVLAEELTFRNVRLVRQAIAEHLVEEASAGRGVMGPRSAEP